MNPEMLFRGSAKCRRLAAAIPMRRDSAVRSLLKLGEDLEAQARAMLDVLEAKRRG